MKMDAKTLALSVGFLYNNSRSKDSASLGEYEIHTPMITLDGTLLFNMSESFKLGPKALVLIGDDVSLADSNKGQKVGLYGGAEGLLSLKKDMSLEMSVQQRIDDLSRMNLLGNIGIRFDF